MRKPDSEIFHLALKNINLRPVQSVFVGDNPVADIKGAKEAGLATVLLAPEDDLECPSADYHCKDLYELEQLF